MISLAYGIFLIFLIFHAITTFKKKRICTALIFDASFIFYYVIPPLRRCLIRDFVSIYALRYNYYVTPTWTAFFTILLFYSMFQLCFYLFSHAKVKRFNYILVNEETTAKKMALYVVLFSAIVFFAYCMLYGGIRNTITMAAMIRDGRVASTNAKYEFLSKLYNVAIYAPILLCSNAKKHKILFFVSFIIALLIQISTGSRGAMLIYFLIFVIGKINNEQSIRKIFKYGFIITLAFIFFVNVYRPLLTAVSCVKTNGLSAAIQMFFGELLSDGRYGMGSFGQAFSTLFNSFDHYYISLETAIQYVDSGIHKCNYFGELFIALTSILPSLVLGIKKKKSLTYYNSAYIAGEFGLAQIPPGIIGSAYYSGGFVWVWLYALFDAVLASGFDRFYLRTKNSIQFAEELYAGMLVLFFSFSVSGDFSSDFQKNLTIILFLLYLKYKLRKVSRNDSSDSVNAHR